MQTEHIYINLTISYLKKETSEEQKNKLFKWVYSSSENEKLFYLIKDIWETANYKQVEQEASTDQEWEKLMYKTIEKETGHFIEKQHKIRRIFKAIQIAAVLIVTFGIGFFLQKYLPGKQEFVSVNVPYGAKTHVELPDGSEVWVNSGSKLTYPSDFKRKKVDLTLEGEAYFNINPNPSRKLNVHTSSIKIQVLGTIFNVKAYSDENVVETSLVKGLISITGESGSKIIEPVLLKPNEQARLIKGEDKFSVVEVKKEDTGSEKTVDSVRVAPRIKQVMHIAAKIDLEPVISWKDNRLVFKSERFEDLVRKMERWYDVKISIEDESLKESKYTGTFENENIEQAIEALSLSLPFTFTIEKNEVRIKQKS